MTDEFSNYRKSDGTIDWGRKSWDEFRAVLEKPQTRSLPLEELNIYKLADEFSDRVWEIVFTWDYFSKKTIGDQWVRAADSVGANIAEGYGRYFFNENVVFLYYSRGSLVETKWWAQKARKRNLIARETYEQLSVIIDQLLLELNKVVKITKLQSKKILRK